MRSRSTIKVDRKKLISLLKERGTCMAQASVNIGFNKSALKNAVMYGTISGPMAAGLKFAYGIAQEDYAPEPEKQPEPEQNEVSEAVQQTLITVDQIYSAVRRAVFDALQDWNEVKQNSPRYK